MGRGALTTKFTAPAASAREPCGFCTIFGAPPNVFRKFSLGGWVADGWGLHPWSTLEGTRCKSAIGLGSRDLQAVPGGMVPVV